MRALLPLCLTLFLIGPTPNILAQAPPSTDIYLVSLRGDRAGTPANVTNRAGYDNQPFFTPDGRGILYTAQHGEQTDIYRYDIRRKSSQQLTTTAESEYSPTPLPSGDGFSVIQVEADGTQRLWKFDGAGQNPQRIFDSIKPVGYQAWADDHHVAMFILGAPPTLQLADARTDTASVHAKSIGRSLHRVPGTETVSYVHKAMESNWVIYAFDPSTGRSNPLTTTLPGREDYAWHPDGYIYMADGAVLHRWSMASGTWTQVADFSSSNISNITRLAISPNGRQLAFVASE